MQLQRIIGPFTILLERSSGGGHSGGGHSVPVPKARKRALYCQRWGCTTNGYGLWNTLKQWKGVLEAKG
ncbi:hypothetical protein GQ43DRAFT_437684 [Delitschia confertaspora ATCC 74209]|uniref:Uncharacterized protein n=1 Tax=Delitschia confertaspora ATCC 74209 TaxID=1513339 RepID=A0A9P4N2E8_9PLEO|nr:hypothetical protein GQ43DRAFT_437684 [Delitschia confertaspora ATCC 74209]